MLSSIYRTFNSPLFVQVFLPTGRFQDMKTGKRDRRFGTFQSNLIGLCTRKKATYESCKHGETMFLGTEIVPFVQGNERFRNIISITLFN